jgi:hypothetical protein
MFQKREEPTTFAKGTSLCCGRFTEVFPLKPSMSPALLMVNAVSFVSKARRSSAVFH